MKRHLIIAILAVILVGIYAVLLHGETKTQAREIPTSNILNRILPIRVEVKEESTFRINEGTVFTIEVDGRQYLITAKHVTNHQAVEVIEIWRNGGWTAVKVKTVGVGKGNEDIIVLAADERLTTTFEIEIGSGGIVLGQNVKFLGFPLDIEVYMTQAKEWRVPVVKGGILTTIESEKGSSWLLVDGHGNKGFSGGPVIFKPREENTKTWRIAGVISRFEPEILSVIDSTGRKIEGLGVVGNSGIMVATGIEAALKLIKANPIGYLVKEK